MRGHAGNYGFQSNEELMLYLKETGYIRSNFVFDIMCSVDRKNFMTNRCMAYRDRPEVVAYEKTISAPHMHAEVLEQMSDNLRHGKFALDIGSGSGYLSICMALALGEKGNVIGVDCIPGLQNMANEIAKNHYPELLKSNRVEYIVWDGRRGWPWSGPYDVIHVGVAATSIPKTLIEQLAPGGCLIMPVGLEGNQVLVLLKKSLNGIIQKKELMKVRYGIFMDVDLPWSRVIGNSSVLNQEIKSKNTLVPGLQNNSTIINSSFSIENIQNIQTDKHVENEASGNINEESNNVATSRNINLINDSFWNSLENISEASKPVSKLQFSISKNSNNRGKERKTVSEKIEIFQKKVENCQKLKSPEDVIAVKLTRKEAVVADTEKHAQSMRENKENLNQVLNDIEANKSVNNENKLFSNQVKENVAHESVLKLKSSIPKIIESDKIGQTKSENIDICGKNIDNYEISKSHRTISTNIEAVFEGSDETNSVNTKTDAQVSYEECENSSRTLPNIQLKQKIHDIIKSLEKFVLTKEPLPNLQSSISIILKQAQSVREKIEFFEKNFGNGNSPNSQEDVTIKINVTPKESDNAVIADTKRDIQLLHEKSKNIDKVLKNEVENVQVHEELHSTSKLLSKSLKNPTKTNKPVSNVQYINSTILESDKTEVQTAQQEIDIVQEETEKSQNSIEKLYVVEKKLNKNISGDCTKVEEQDKCHDKFISELTIFKDEVKVMLDTFLSNDKENSDENNPREINIDINRVNQIQSMNNHGFQQESNGENLERTEKFSKNLSIEEQDSKSNELQSELRNVTEKVEKLQSQFDKNVENCIAINEKLQEREIYYENLEERLQKLEQRFKLLTRILVKLLEKIKCHEKVLNIHLVIAEKKEASRVFDKQRTDKTQEKIDKLTRIISRINEEIQLIIESDSADNATEGESEHLIEQSESMRNAYFSSSESFLSELNLIKTLLYLGKESSTNENAWSLNDKSEAADDETDMSLIKSILEE